MMLDRNVASETLKKQILFASFLENRSLKHDMLTSCGQPYAQTFHRFYETI